MIADAPPANSVREHQQRLIVAATFVEKSETIAAVVARLLKVARQSGVRIMCSFYRLSFYFFDL